jgi:cation diffusion facilitator CzcD-associated flavoprotein CzcO
METHYYEAYNQENVQLVDILETPIDSITDKTVKTTAGDYECDILVYATGFSASKLHAWVFGPANAWIVTGSFDAIDFRGVNGARLVDKWAAGPETYLGLTVKDFPNMFMSIGPHQAYGNIPRSIEYAVGWIAECIEYLEKNNITRLEASQKKVEEWTDHVHDLGKGLLSNEIDSWMTGVNKNLPGKQKRVIARYSGAAPDFRRTCDAVASEGYRAFVLS